MRQKISAFKQKKYINRMIEMRFVLPSGQVSVYQSLTTEENFKNIPEKPMYEKMWKIEGYCK